jgi:Flp pilus assembly protein CpaB
MKEKTIAIILTLIVYTFAIIGFVKFITWAI